MLQELSRIEAEEGKAAAEAYEKAEEAKQEEAIRLKAAERPKLFKSLLEQGICPFTDSEGIRQVFMYDEDFDLARVPNTDQNLDSMLMKRNAKKFLEEKSYTRYVVKCIHDDLRLKGEDPVEYFRTHQENTMKIQQMRPRDAKKMAEAYKSVIDRQGSITAPDVIKKIREQKGLPEDPADDAKFEAEREAAAAAAAAGSSTKTSKGAAAAKAKEEAVQRRAARLQAKSAKRESYLAAKSERRAAREEARVEAQKAKDAAKAAVAAGAAAATAAAASAASEAAASVTTIADAAKAAKHAAADAEIAATSGMDFAATAGQEAVSRSTLESASSAPEKSAAKAASTSKKSPLTIIKASAVVALGGGGAFAFKTMKDKAAEEEAERERQFKLIMGLEGDDEDDDAGTITDDWMSGPSETPKKVDSAPAAAAPVPEMPKKKKKVRGLKSMFSKAGSDRETDITELFKPDAEAPEFALLLAKILTYGAPGRFPYITAQPGGMPFEEGEDGGFNLDSAKILLMESRISKGLTDQASAELFASVVNCMIIDIIDLASSSLKGEDKTTVAALNVVMEFMDHAASLFDAVAQVRFSMA